jgi:capsular polysaccharide biosynthesis protein
MRHDSRSMDDDSDDESFDLESTKEMASLVLRSPRRHPKLAALVFLSVAILGMVAALLIKPTFQSEAIILVQRNVALPAFGENQRNAQNDVDPAAGVQESVKGRENLISLVRQTHLTERYDGFKGQPTEEEKVQALAKLLEFKVNVKTDGTTVTFSAEWSDPQTAYDLVAAAVHNFLDGRNTAEVSIISDSITLLEEHAKNERQGIDGAMEEFISLKNGGKGAAAPPPAPGADGAAPVYRPRPVIPIELGTDPDIAKKLEDKKQQIKETEEERRRQLSELKTQMAGLLGTYTPSHPAVTALQRKIDTLAEEPANLVALKNEERSLLSQIAAATGAKNDALKAAARAGGPMPVMTAVPTGAGKTATPLTKQDLEVSDPASAMALSKMQNRIHKYEEFMDQISAAKLQLDLARNAFKYRYSMYKPAEVPTKPKRPIQLLLGAAGAILGLLLALVVSAGVDLASGLFIEPWQVRRRLSLPVLGEVLRP